jgi:hypothetical protein
MKSPTDRWAVASGAAAAVAAVAALWGQGWADGNGHDEHNADGSGRTSPTDPSAVAAADRSIVAGGDVTGIASTGDDATNIQQR